jgi:GNAT superfamily N-acetyltransferase
MLLADLALARRVEGAQAQGRADAARAHSRCCPGAGIAVEAVGGGFAIINPCGPPTTRAHAFGLGMNGPVTEADLGRLADFYRGLVAHVNLCPLAHPSLLELLGRRGYRVVEWNNVLVRALGGEEAAGPLPAGLEARPAAAAEAELWARVVAQGYSGQEEVGAALGAGVALFDLLAVRCFLGLVGGEPAGGGAVAWHQGVATLLGTSTLPRFRGRGLQAALLQARLALAARQGCDLATTNTDPGSTSQRNVERQGFRVAYTRPVLALDR